MGRTLVPRHLFLSWVLVVVLLVELPCNADEQLEERKEALRKFVHAYVRAEKEPSYENVLEEVKLIVGDDDNDEIFSDIEQVVQDAIEDTHVYADRLVMDMLKTVRDPDCMEGEFDASDGNFNAAEAAHVLHKCKLLVLRNVFDQDFLQAYKANITAFIQGLKNGNIAKTGTTTNKEHYFQHNLDHGRWEVLLPQSLAHPIVVQNARILRVLMKDMILGPRFNLHSFGTALADSGAHPQDWHTDSDYLFADGLYKTTGISQHELPAYAITMMVPLLHMTPEHGPTQFGMGSSNLAGLAEKREDILLRNEWLRQFINAQPEEDEEYDVRDHYEYMRTPLLSFGDVLLFDYMITHRGGRNVSPDLRAMLYLTYSRFWYKDKGFEDEDEEDREEQSDTEMKLYKKLTQTARFAIPDNFGTDEVEDWSQYGDGDRSLEAMGSFQEQTGNQANPRDSDEEL